MQLKSSACPVLTVTAVIANAMVTNIPDIVAVKRVMVRSFMASKWLYWQIIYTDTMSGRPFSTGDGAQTIFT